MYLLQEVIIGGMVILVVIGIALLIGIAVITILLGKAFKRKEDKCQVPENTFEPQNKEDQLQQKKASKQFISIVVAIIIMFIFIAIAILILDSMFPGYE